ncbi:PilC/PilY family type IV pilus protein [Candidatus Pelagibacter sp.]|nr:PilC/PilY family type IV pilus protein [Candidatus Pelagibacter sp.]
MKYLKLISIFFIFIFLNNNSYSKPVPPGAGDGEVAANILFLVDSSASMQSWIGDQGLGATPKAVYDSQGRILINQNGRNAVGLLRYTAAGERDDTFMPMRLTPSEACDETNVNFATSRRSMRRNAGLNFVRDFRGNTGDHLFFTINRERRDRNVVYGFTEDGTDCRIGIRINLDRASISDIDFKVINDTPYLFIAGPWRRGGHFSTCNLSGTPTCITQEFRGNVTLRRMGRLSVNNEGTMVYVTSTADGDLYGYNLDVTSGTPLSSLTAARRCSNVDNPNLSSGANEMIDATTVAVSPDDSNIVYLGSRINHAIQKLELTDTTCTVVASIGAGSNSVLTNTATAGELEADDVRFSRVWGMHVDQYNNRILTATSRGYVDEFNENNFTVASRDTAWLQQMGGPRIRRWDGVKQAINAIVNDTTLTTGAHFGFGHWNAGESGKHKNSNRGGKYCHTKDDCSYYTDWEGVTITEGGQTKTLNHPNGTSELCNSDSCINVGISSRGASQIMGVLEPLGLAWGTDSNAFAQLASKYFNDPNAGGQVFDPDSQCQLNYVIVIGDGAMMNSGFTHRNFRNPNTTTTQKGEAGKTISALREKGVKTLMVAYGGGIRPGAMDLFDRFAEAGSCATAGSDECEPTIVADTPEELKSELTSKIRQIIADKLAFTAPSITATIQEGGALYQAQFAYEQFGEWKGTLLRKKIDGEGNVEHQTSKPNPYNNWSASVEIKGQSKATDVEDSRKIWTAMPGATYYNNWDNFNVSNTSAITNLFDILGYTVQDYHHLNSTCTSVGLDGNKDDITGLINYMKGVDYFDYDGDCNVTEVRDHVMGDIYHSQLIEVGAPDASLDFSNSNEEAYHRSINNYAGFMTKHANRKNIIYAGSNSGCLHAINAETGQEEWCFIPPFVGALIPQIVNRSYDGNVDSITIVMEEDSDGTKTEKEVKVAVGGTNPIFGVDGSPVVHDMYIEGYSSAGVDESKKWRTILFLPYGRGGAGFSVLDITNPIIEDSKGPIHMFSIFNDQINKKILIADHEGNIREEVYNSAFSSVLQSEEGIQALDNYTTARDADETTDPSGETTTEQDLIAGCTGNTTDGDFKDVGTSACYKGTTFHFANIILDYADNTTIPAGVLSAKLLEGGVSKALGISSAKMVDGLLQVTFADEKIVNAYVTDSLDGDGNQKDNDSEKNTDQFAISTACKGATGIAPEYDYTQLGETWSTPRIVRIPDVTETGSVASGGINTDKYVAIMGGGMSKNDSCAGSAIFLVDLSMEDRDSPGKIFGAEVNGGPINIVDTSPAGITIGATTTATPNGSDISNAIPAAPLVITPDTAFGIPWRGAMVYINDLEGKITKINLTDSTENNADMFSQTTLFRLNSTIDNARYSYFAMDAGIGVSKGQFMLFGSTGNFTDLGGREENMDNILYGVVDPDYPNFKHLNGQTIPKGKNTEFVPKALQGADKANSVDNANVCKNVTGSTDFANCIDNKNAWVIKLGKDSSDNMYLPKTFRKASASPTLFKGQVYFPIYQPPPNDTPCEQGSAFICVSDDECGYNNSAKLKLNTPADVENPSNNACAFVRKGVLSELVIFADKLFANVAGPTGDEDTLFSILSVPGEIMQNKGGWRDSSF